ncbi:MAG: NADH-quinone oxidoreductase subunit N [Phycisphaerae bacterium]|nr:NADH-quinone oxidoreductase subunit N [Phycisphaerae bacterium]
MTLLGSTFWMPTTSDLASFAPELVLIGTIVAVLVVPLITPRASRLTALVAGIGILLLAMATVSVAGSVVRGIGGLSPSGRAPMLVVDHLSLAFKMLLSLFLAGVVLLWLLGGKFRDEDSPEFFVLLLGSALGMSLMVSTVNLLMLVIAMELASLPSYVLAGFFKRNRIGAEASMKYAVFGAIASAAMIYGCSLLYGIYGTLDIPTLALQIGQPGAGAGGGLLSLALVGLGVGLLFKISAFPLHFWCPDVFEGAPIEVTTWLSVASKGAGLVALLRVVFCLGHPGIGIEGVEAARALLGPMATTIGVVAAITCTVGNLAAYRQASVKRMLAYSSIAHAGYMLMAAAILTSNAGISAVIAYLIVYLFMNLGAFGCVALVYWATGSESSEAFRGLRRRAPWLALAMAAFLFSLVGLPPFGGWIAKFKLLWALGQADLWWLVVVAAVNTLFSLYYYARLVWVMFFDDDDQPIVRAPALGQTLLVGCAVVLLLTGTVMASWLVYQADAYARDLYVPALTKGTLYDAVGAVTMHP